MSDSIHRAKQHQQEERRKHRLTERGKPAARTLVKFQYFKDSGKYYSEGEHFFADHLPFHDAVERSKDLLKRGVRPGLIDGHEFDVLLTVFTEDGPLPVLLVRGRTI